jgi:hypothetical protein
MTIHDAIRFLNLAALAIVMASDSPCTKRLPNLTLPT